LHLNFPYRYLAGEIIPPGNAANIKCDENLFNFFFWGNGRLIGPLSGNELKIMISSINPYSYFSSPVEEKPEEPVIKRLYRLKQRKMRLKQQKVEKKQ
jgi:hypothetical protein